MTDREAMQQALYVLERVALHLMRPQDVEVMQALRARLEQQQAEPVKEQTFFCFNCDKNVTQGCFAPNCRPHWGK